MPNMNVSRPSPVPSPRPSSHSSEQESAGRPARPSVRVDIPPQERRVAWNPSPTGRTAAWVNTQREGHGLSPVQFVGPGQASADAAPRQPIGEHAAGNGAPRNQGEMDRYNAMVSSFRQLPTEQREFDARHFPSPQPSAAAPSTPERRESSGSASSLTWASNTRPSTAPTRGDSIADSMTSSQLEQHLANLGPLEHFPTPPPQSPRSPGSPSGFTDPGF